MTIGQCLPQSGESLGHLIFNSLNRYSEFIGYLFTGITITFAHQKYLTAFLRLKYITK